MRPSAELDRLLVFPSRGRRKVSDLAGHALACLYELPENSHRRSKLSTFRSRERFQFPNPYGKSRLPYDFGYVTIPHGSPNPSIVRTGLYEFASTTITLLDRPQANRI